MPILFVAETVTLAHLARPLFLAQCLQRAGREVAIACAERHRALIPAGIDFYPLDSIAPASFAQRLARGAPVYRLAELRAYVDADRALLARLRPTAVIGDFRLSLSVSARLAGVPYLNIANAYWRESARTAVPVPDLAFLTWLPLALAQTLFTLSWPIAQRVHARALNQLRREHGLPALPAQLATVYTDADSLLLADLPSLYPALREHARCRFLGYLPWEPPVALPDWWPQISAREPRTLAWITLGSSGDLRRLRPLVEAARARGLTVLLSTAGRPVEAFSDPEVFVTELLPPTPTAAQVGLIVSNGGSQMTAIAAAAGRPSIAVPGNLDQFLNCAAFERRGVLCSVRGDRINRDRVEQALDAMLTTNPAREQALQALQTEIAGIDPATVLIEALDEIGNG